MEIKAENIIMLSCKSIISPYHENCAYLSEGSLT